MQEQETTKNINSYMSNLYLGGAFVIKSLDQFKSFFENETLFKIETSLLKSVDLNITNTITKDKFRLTFDISDKFLAEDLITNLIKFLIPFQYSIKNELIKTKSNNVCQTEINQTLSFNEQKNKLEDYIKTLDMILDSFNWNSEIERTNRKQELVIEWMKNNNFMTEVLEINNSEKRIDDKDIPKVNTPFDYNKYELLCGYMSSIYKLVNMLSQDTSLHGSELDLKTTLTQTNILKDKIYKTEKLIDDHRFLKFYLPYNWEALLKKAKELYLDPKKDKVISMDSIVKYLSESIKRDIYLDLYENFLFSKNNEFSLGIHSITLLGKPDEQGNDTFWTDVETFDYRKKSEILNISEIIHTKRFDICFLDKRGCNLSDLVSQIKPDHFTVVLIHNGKEYILAKYSDYSIADLEAKRLAKRLGFDLIDFTKNKPVVENDIKQPENHVFSLKELALKLRYKLLNNISDSELEEYIIKFKKNSDRFNSISVSIHGVKEIGVRDEIGKTECVIDEVNPSFLGIYLFYNGLEYSVIDCSSYTEALEVGIVLASKYNWSIRNFVKRQK